MGPSFDVHCYNGCIVGGLRFLMLERDSRRTTQNSGVMVIGESDASESVENNFYGVLDEVLHIQYQLGRNFWLFKYRWHYVVIPSGFDETDVMFLKFEENLDNLAKASSLIDDNLGNERIQIMITPGAEKPIFPHAIRFSQAIGNQMLELQSQPTQEGSTQPFSGDEICETVLGRRPDYSKDLVRDPSSRPARQLIRAVP
ncbi:hypothetical protein E5676_scaffold142G00360 [Cucumis melo var. makuwa]|uniref:Uncharacterized protein n=1 Tax=Cucumis melo var. makuwa TaxID=1194695 RepID=A0A5A7U3F2_CUCMM|nr:hypothetical protein E6C27_scaffold76G001640 [Cucumis melo var. makuwa]TYK23065.1 hypothetical protein E5676_scaffold142G00360 [Cucumis melo var. makuwa]